VAAPAPPKLALSATVVDFGRLRLHGPSPERRVRLGNAGGRTLNAQATTQASWLQLRRVGDEVVVAVDTTAVGEHEGVVTVDSDGGSATIRVLARVDPASSPATSATAATDREAAADKAPQEAPGEAAPSQLVATPGASLARDPRGTQDAPRGPEPPTPSAPVLPREERPGGKPRLPKWLGQPTRIISAAAVLVIIVIVALIVLGQTHNRKVTTTPAEQTNNPNVATIPVEALPANVAVGEGAVWVANTQHGTVARIDPATRKVTTIKVGQTPSGVAVGAGAVWVANNGDDTVARIDPATNQKVATIKVGAHPQNVAVGAGAVWVVNSGNEGSRIDPDSNRVGGFTAFGRTGLPSGVAVGAGYVWVANSGDNTVARINPTSHRVVDTIPVGPRPQGVAVGAGAVWVANDGDDTVSRIDPATGEVTTIKVGPRP